MAEPILSIVVPTRERASYLTACLQTCIANPLPELEILVLDNASRDDTPAVMAQISDPRVRYVRSERRLSMRDNFEKGINESRGRYIGFIGDDDGVFPFTAERVVALFEANGVDAVAAARAHYSWPDLLMARAGMGLVPRGRGVEIRRSRERLRGLLADDNYYALPCVYHGFVARTAIERASVAQGRFFVSSIVDCASAIALSMLDISYVYSHTPLVINGGSRRSNGASQFGGGSEQEQASWKVEDDLGYLPGYDDTETVGALIVETAARSAAANPGRMIADIFDLRDIRKTLLRELAFRRAKGRDEEEAFRMFDSAGIPRPVAGDTAPPSTRIDRLRRSGRLFLHQCPLDLKAQGVTTVSDAAQVMTEVVERRHTSLLHNPLGQLRVARRMAG